MRQFLVREPQFTQIAGSFNSWKPETYENSFLIKTEEERVQFKFIENNGNWLTSNLYETCEDDGNVNNWAFTEISATETEVMELVAEKVQLDNVVAFESAPVNIEPISATDASDILNSPKSVDVAAIEIPTIQFTGTDDAELPACPPNSPVSALEVQEESLKAQTSEQTLSSEIQTEDKSAHTNETLTEKVKKFNEKAKKPSFLKKMFKMFSKKKQTV